MHAQTQPKSLRDGGRGGGDPGLSLVVGADGTLGRALAERLRGEGREVIATTRRPGGRGLHLDLADPPSAWSPLPDRRIDAAFLCAAVTSLDACRRQPAASRKVNVEHTLALARTLAARGTAIVFPSTSLVFDGRQPNVPADAPLSPLTEYGRQKADAERQLLRLPTAVCVVRMTKVLARAPRLLVQWRDDLLAGKTIHPFSDMSMSPVPLEFARDALLRAAALRAAGVVQVSAVNDVSYASIAQHLAIRAGVDGRLVQPVRAADAVPPFEHVPTHTSLDVTRLREEFHLTPPDVWSTVDQALPGSPAR